MNIPRCEGSTAEPAPRVVLEVVLRPVRREREVRKYVVEGIEFSILLELRIAQRVAALNVAVEPVDEQFILAIA